jgi:hypothetical protein
MKKADYFFNIEELAGSLDWLVSKLHVLQDFATNKAVIKIVYAENISADCLDLPKIPLGINIFLDGDEE